MNGHEGRRCWVGGEEGEEDLRESGPVSGNGGHAGTGWGKGWMEGVSEGV